ncbi:MAG: hypothetical protein PHX62_06685, partial [Bacilli bacterium]|nr:hypothetical protein [Bacilli bacterium]
MKVKDIISQSLTSKISTIILMVFSMMLSVACLMFGVLVIRKLVDTVLVTNISEDPHLAYWVTGFVFALLAWFGFRTL